MDEYGDLEQLHADIIELFPEGPAEVARTGRRGKEGGDPTLRLPGSTRAARPFRSFRSRCDGSGRVLPDVPLKRRRRLAASWKAAG
jgi:hypothetical protein